LVFAILIAMVFANILFLILGYFLIPFFARIVTIRKGLLLPLTIVFAFAGSYVFRSDPMDLVILVVFAIFGYIARKLKFDVTPMVMGFILGPILEYSFGQTVTLAQGNLLGYIAMERPITLAILLLTPLVIYFLWRRNSSMRNNINVSE